MKPVQKPTEQGIALMIVMIMILVLSALAGGFAYSMKVESKLAQNNAFDSDIQWLGRSGVELAKFELSQQLSIPEPFDAFKQKWAGGPGQTNDILATISLEDNQLGEGVFSVKIIDAERKLNINAAPEPVIQQALTLVGADASALSIIVDSIKDWRDRDESQSMAGAESDYYLSLKPPYVSKNGPIGDITELLQVKGMTPEIFWGSSGPGQVYNAPSSGGVLPQASGSLLKSTLNQRGNGLAGVRPMGFASVDGGLYELFTAIAARQININTASASVLQLIPGVDNNIAAAIVQHRAGYDGVEGTLDDTPFVSPSEVISVPGVTPGVASAMSSFCTVRSFTFEVRVNAEIGGYKRTFVALLRRANARDIQTLYMHWL